MHKLKVRLRLTITLFVLLFMSQNTFAQISKEHYIPPISGIGYGIIYKLVLTTLSVDPFTVTITNGDGTFYQEVELSRDFPQEIIPELNGVNIGLPLVSGLSTYPQTNLDGVFNTVLTEHGLIIKGETPFFANLMLTMNSQAEVLTSKGTAGLGQKFFSGHQHTNYITHNDGNVKSHFISVMALEDNTEIQFSNPKLLFHGQTNHVFSVNLNAFESYIVGNSMIGIAKECGTTDLCMNDYNGTQITSSKDISVNSGSIMGGYSKSITDPSRDIGFDQIVPVEFAGQQFILIEGNGTSSNALNEVGIVVSTQANTTIHVNGLTDASNTYFLANAGDYVVIPWDKYTDKNMFIQSDKDVYVYQTLAGSSATQTPGMIFIPRLTLDATKEVYISGVSAVGTPALYLVTERGSQVSINKVILDPSTALSVQGNEGWDAYRIQDLKPYGGPAVDFHILSTGILNAGVSFANGSAGGGGYYSGFSKDKSNAGIGNFGKREFDLYCEATVELVAKGGIKYVWSATNPVHEALIDRVNDSTYHFIPKTLTPDGSYKFQVITTVETLSGDRQDTTILKVNLLRLGDEFGGAKQTCVGESVQLNEDASSRLDEFYLWDTNPFLSSTLIASPVFKGDSSMMDQETVLGVTFDDGICHIPGSVKILTEDCTRPKLVNSWIYDEDNDGVAETIRVKFTEPFYDFDKLSSIDWPSEGGNNLNSTFANTSYDTLSNGDVDSNKIIIDLRGEFEFGTSADTSNIPFLDYYWDSIKIKDRIGPVIVSAQKTYPTEPQYATLKNGEYQFHDSPIKIRVQTSEPISFDPDQLKQLFVYKDKNGELFEHDLIQSVKLGETENEWIVTIAIGSEIQLALFDSLSFNRASPFQIKDDEGNLAGSFFVEIEEGKQVLRNELQTVFREPIFGTTSKSETRFKDQMIGLYDDDGNFIKLVPIQVSMNQDWVAPYNFVNGKFINDAACIDEMAPEPFPKSCLSSLAMLTSADAGAYKAKIYIFDHLGYFVTNWTQRFGYCGELDNPYRAQSSSNKGGLVHDLVWDMKDLNHRKVATGVYIWKVILEFENGSNETVVQRMGSARRDFKCRY